MKDHPRLKFRQTLEDDIRRLQRNLKYSPMRVMHNGDSYWVTELLWEDRELYARTTGEPNLLRLHASISGLMIFERLVALIRDIEPNFYAHKFKLAGPQLGRWDISPHERREQEQRDAKRDTERALLRRGLRAHAESWDDEVFCQRGNGCAGGHTLVDYQAKPR